jgi:hypothetical protein
VSNSIWSLKNNFHLFRQEWFTCDEEHVIRLVLEIERNSEMTTLRQARHSHFQRGSGVFNCDSCGRSTRVTTQDNDKICAECYDLAGETNSLSDYGELYAGVESVQNTFNLCVTRGGSVEKLLREFPEVAEAAGWTGTGAATLIKSTDEQQKETTTMFTVTAKSANGLDFTGVIAAATPGAAIKEMRAAVKLAKISRKVGRIDFRAKKA